jgi:hypothetical protein
LPALLTITVPPWRQLCESLSNRILSRFRH